MNPPRLRRMRLKGNAAVVVGGVAVCCTLGHAVAAPAGLPLPGGVPTGAHMVTAIADSVFSLAVAMTALLIAIALLLRLAAAQWRDRY